MSRSQPPPSASRHYATSALLAARAASEARKVKPQGLLAVARVVKTHQMTQAVLSERAVAEMLLEQEIDAQAEATLNSLAFTTDMQTLEAMVNATADAEFERLMESITQDAGRSAESVAIALMPDIYHVRYVTPPCCGRCAVLAGRVYRWSEGFKRHPNCSCVMAPTTVAAPFAQSPDQLFDAGQIRGLSKADAKAIRHGADVGQVVNVRKRAAGLNESGRALARAGRPTPEGIYRLAGTDRNKAVELLGQYGYVR